VEGPILLRVFSRIVFVIFEFLSDVLIVVVLPILSQMSVLIRPLIRGKLCPPYCHTICNPSRRSSKLQPSDDVLSRRHIPHFEMRHYRPDLVLGPPFQSSGHV
jgi:hypothetical protein